MHIVFFILSAILIKYSATEPKCLYGVFIFAAFGLFLMAEPANIEEPKRKKR